MTFLFFSFTYCNEGQINYKSQVNETMYAEIMKMEAQLTYGTFALIGILVLILLIIRFRSQGNA